MPDTPVSASIAFKDFVPKQEGTKPALLGLLQNPVYADLDEAMASANQWIASTGVRILNVETVLLPQYAATQFANTNQSAWVINHDMPQTWRQFIRVWYVEAS